MAAVACMIASTNLSIPACWTTSGTLTSSSSTLKLHRRYAHSGDHPYRGSEPADIDLLPTVWFRNTWSWQPGSRRPSLRLKGDYVELEPRDLASPMVEDLGLYRMHAAVASDGSMPTWLFTENETNSQRLFKRTQRWAVQERCISSLRHSARVRRSQSSANGHQSCCTLPLAHSRARTSDCATETRRSLCQSTGWRCF